MKTNLSISAARGALWLLVIWSPFAAISLAAQTLSAPLVERATAKPLASESVPKAARTAAATRTKSSRRAAQSARRAPTLKLDVKQTARLATLNEKPSAYVFPQDGLTANMRQNIYGPASPTAVEMGDRPARSLGLCGDGKYRRFAELDARTVAALLPEFNTVRPRTICARRGVLIADYAFK